MDKDQIEFRIRVAEGNKTISVSPLPLGPGGTEFITIDGITIQRTELQDFVMDQTQKFIKDKLKNK